jgi:hypothetical protein
MNVKQLIVVIGIILNLFASAVQAHGPKGEFYRLTSTDIIAVFAGKTLYSVNERTKDEVLTFLSKDGAMKQSIKSLNIQRTGKWHPANDQLCLHFENKDSEYCFDSILFHDDIFYLFKDRKIETVVNDGVEGDQTGF